MDQVVQIAGALLILVGFLAAQFKMLDTSSVPYLLVNLIGAAVLTVVAYLGQQWGFFILEGVWTLVSAWGLVSQTRLAAR
jgi:putative flippase GtrA